MRLVDRLLQGLSNEYRQQSEQQCFVAHEFDNRDIRSRLTKALEIGNLQPYFADSELTSNVMLSKICGKILATRAFVVDVSICDPNLYFELGLAIGFNKPILAVAKEGSIVPAILHNFVNLRFTHYSQLEQEFSKQMPVWFATVTEANALYSSHCHFLNRLCDARNRLSPGRTYYLIDETHSVTGNGCTATQGTDPDLREAMLTALNRFQFELALLDNAPSTDDFRFCDMCRASRDAAFGVVHISERTGASVYLLAGLFLGLGIDFLLLVRTPDERGKDIAVPTLLQGLDYLTYQHFADLEERLPKKLEEFLNQYKTKPLIDRVLIDLPTDDSTAQTGRVLDWSVMKAGNDHARLIQEQAEEMFVDGFPRVLAYIYVGNNRGTIELVEQYLAYALRHRDPFIDAYNVQFSWPKSLGNNHTIERMVLDGFGVTSLREISQKLEMHANGPNSLRKNIWIQHRLLKVSRETQLSLANYVAWVDTVLTSSLPESTHVITQLFVQTPNHVAFAASLAEMLRTSHPAAKSVIRIAHDIEDTHEPREYWGNLLFKEQRCG